jgi:hypothetical protein
MFPEKVQIPQLVKKFPLFYITHFLNIQFSVILTSTPRSSKWFFPSGFTTNILCAYQPFHMRATRPAISFYFCFFFMNASQN